MELLAAVNWEDIILVGSAIGLFGGGKMIYGWVRTKNGNGDKFSQKLCDEKHANIESRHGELKQDVSELKTDMREGFKVVFTKLDHIQDNLSKRP